MLSTTMLVLTPDCARCRGAAPVTPTWRLRVLPRDGVGGDYDGELVRELLAAGRAREREMRRGSYDNTACVCGLEECCELVQLWDFGVLVLVYEDPRFIEIRPRDLPARLDEWVPWWRLSRMSVIDPAEPVPPDERV